MVETTVDYIHTMFPVRILTAYLISNSGEFPATVKWIWELRIDYINEFGQPPSLRDKDYINRPSLAWTCWDSEGARRGGGY